MQARCQSTKFPGQSRPCDFSKLPPREGLKRGIAVQGFALLGMWDYLRRVRPSCGFKAADVNTLCSGTGFSQSARVFQRLPFANRKLMRVLRLDGTGLC